MKLLAYRPFWHYTLFMLLTRHKMTQSFMFSCRLEMTHVFIGVWDSSYIIYIFSTFLTWKPSFLSFLSFFSFLPSSSEPSSDSTTFKFFFLWLFFCLDHDHSYFFLPSKLCSEWGIDFSFYFSAGLCSEFFSIFVDPCEFDNFTLFVG